MRPVHPGDPRHRPGRLFRIGAALCAGLLCASAFPPLEWSAAAWFGLAPLWAAVAGQRGRPTVGYAVLAGMGWWLLSLAWITRVTYAGWFVLAGYCSVYMVPPALLMAAWTRRYGVRSWTRNLGGIAAMAAAWTAGEYVRGMLFTGFPWNGLGVSQYRHLPLIQHASWGGVCAVSWLVAWGNAAAAFVLTCWIQRVPGRLGRMRPEFMAALALPLLGVGSGWLLWTRVPEPDARTSIALIQPAIPQDRKWTNEFFDEVYARLDRLSALACRSGRPELLVWPETAVPEDLQSPYCHTLIETVTGYGPPLLAGLLRAEPQAGGGEACYFNSSFLLGRGARILDIYDKRHLVVFGEYVPFKRWLPFLQSLTPIEGDITPGRRVTVFALPDTDVRFSVLICFEDTLDHLSRDAVRAGANLLVIQTNDAWFDPTSGSRQHLLQSVFRAVENRVPCVRCANTGVSAWIDARGVLRKVQPYDLPAVGQAAGFMLAEVAYRIDPAPTFFCRYGNVFGGSQLVLTLLVAGWLRARRARAAPAAQNPLGDPKPIQ